MNVRLAVLGVWLAALPLAVDLPAARDSSRGGPLQVELAGGFGQFAIVNRGCNGEVLRVTRNQLRSGALVVERRLPRDFVLGVRAGSVRTTPGSTTTVHADALGYQPGDTIPASARSNPYVNPYVGYEGRWVGLGIGGLKAGQPFVIDEYLSRKAQVTGHVRLGGDPVWATLRWMEDVPLESEGHFSVELAARTPRVEAGAFAGFVGPYDGVMLGLRGRVWLTPEAALQIKTSTAAGNHDEYGVYGSVVLRSRGAR